MQKTLLLVEKNFEGMRKERTSEKEEKPARNVQNKREINNISASMQVWDKFTKYRIELSKMYFVPHFPSALLSFVY